jgi:Tfp pilus assembly protein PilO
MAKENTAHWRLDRRISLAVLLQLMVLVSLILGSWVNLQRQLDSLQHDVTTLLANQKESQQKLERLSNQGLSCEYRLQAVERRLGDTVTTTIR